MSERNFDTNCVVGGYEIDPVTHSRCVPLYMTNAYTFDSVEHARALFALEQPGNIYTRIMNPTTDVLEKRVALLEGGIGALGAASGHSAMVMTFLNLASAGDEIVSSRAIYGGARNMMGKTMALMGITFKFVDSDDPEAFAKATTDRTKAWFVETIGNPGADIPDIRRIADLAHGFGIPLIADNTVATPWLMKPFEHGADIVIHSTSKFLSGNGAVIGGLTVDSGNFNFLGNPRFPQYNEPDESYHGLVYAQALGRAAFITKLRTHILRDVGAAMSPFNAWVALLGIETLGLRMRRHCDTALKIAEFLAKHPKVKNVNYPGLKASPYYKLHQTYCPRGASAVYTFDLHGGRDAAARFCDALELIPIVTNLGDTRTIVSCPASTTHSQMSDEALREAGIDPGTVRLSVGLEDADDLLRDIEQGLARA